MLLRAAIVGLVLAVLAGSAAWMVWGGRFVTEEQVADLQAMVLLHRFEHIQAQIAHGISVAQGNAGPQGAAHSPSGSGGKAGAAAPGSPIFFVTIHARDPDDALVKRFEEAGWTVRPGSQYVKGKGAYVRIDATDRPDDDHLVIGGEYHTGKKPDYRFTARLRWHWDGWRITSEEGVPIKEPKKAPQTPPAEESTPSVEP
jgi:hypothetical protein